MALLPMCLAKEWLSLFSKKQSIVLRIDEGCVRELFIHPESHCDGGLVWLVRLLAKLFPSPDLWILLDPAALGLHSTHQDVVSEQALRQIEAYRSFVKTTKQYVILDASKPSSCVTEKAYAAIIDTLATRTERQLKTRLRCANIRSL
jgi:hypothetical protein